MRHDLKECGNHIQQLRKERELTQEQLAEQLNVSQNMINIILVSKFGNILYIGKEITFDKDNQIEFYKKLYSIADFLYFNRVKIRELKAKTVEKIY